MSRQSHFSMNLRLIKLICLCIVWKGLARNDFDQGWGQCLAELVAAQKLNDQSDRVVYGIVTDGKRWEIGKLIQNQFTQNACGYTVEQIAQLFGALQAIFDAATEGK